MRVRAPLRPLPLAALFLAFLVAAPGTWLPGAPPVAQAGPQKRPPEPPGVRWESGVEAALARAAREGRPLLVCVNALENERANIQLATESYRSEAWGRATRPYVCLVGNPQDHAETAGVCSRYGHAPCSAHKQTLQWVMRSLVGSNDLISPQHLIVEPDGQIAYRKEYFTGEERPFLFETYLSMLAPDLAQRIAAIDREARIAALGKVPTPKLREEADAWLGAPEDGLVGAGLLVALAEASEPARRLALIAALARLPEAQVPVLEPLVESLTYAPDERPAETLAWVEALLRAHPPTGTWAGARALVRSRSADLRKKLQKSWGEASAGGWAAREEALRLAGLPVGKADGPSDEASLTPLVRARLVRARQRSSTGSPPLPADLSTLSPGDLRRVLLAAAPERVAQRGEDVEAILSRAPFARVRVAAALALLGAKRAAGGATVRAVLTALVDPVEGPEARAEAGRRLGVDLGEDADAWAEALTAFLGGAR